MRLSHSEVADRREGSGEICGVLRSDRMKVQSRRRFPVRHFLLNLGDCSGDCNEGGRRSPVTRRIGEELEALKLPVLQTRSNPVQSRRPPVTISGDYFLEDLSAAISEERAESLGRNCSPFFLGNYPRKELLLIRCGSGRSLIRWNRFGSNLAISAKIN
ncbi:hypothetical protein U1Q18_024515 [Sarracenia purpurea var. burkii]